MRKLYHGCAKVTAEQVLQQGLLPRKVTKNKGNWKHTVNSNTSMVYLTTAYAPYFAFCALTNLSDPAAIIEIDLDSLDSNNLFPDEDFVEQVNRTASAEVLRAYKLTPLINKTMKQRTQWIRTNIHRWKHAWQQSMNSMGNLCHKGPIPVTSITKVVSFALNDNAQAAQMALDPMISLANFKFCGKHYEALTRHFMGEHVTPKELQIGSYSDPVMEQKYQETMEELLKNPNIEVLYERKIK